jgi:hypothetical protein
MNLRVRPCQSEAAEITVTGSRFTRFDPSSGLDNQISGFRQYRGADRVTANANNSDICSNIPNSDTASHWFMNHRQQERIDF